MITKREPFLAMLILLACLHVPFASAQTCPVGSYPVGGGNAGWEGCVPMNDTAPAPPSGPQWITRWMSVAFGKTEFGAATDMPSKRKAEKAALAQCRAKGAADCRVRMTTYNQCIAVAAGGDSAPSVRAVDQKTAETLALEDCAKNPKNTNCGIYYSACSFPVRVR